MNSRDTSHHTTRAVIVVSCLLLWVGFQEARARTEVFYTDFESGIPSEFSAPGSATEPVQGYAGLGPPGGEFAGNFLRYAAVEIFDTTLTLDNLPPHSSLTLEFLLAVIDSWDGAELLQVRVDGELLFSHWFQLATGDQSSYVHPPGGLLSSGTDLGFSAGTYYHRDRAYDMGLEPAFIDIPHTSSDVTIVWSISAVSGSAAENWQGGIDESWAIENVRVSVAGDAPAGAGRVDGLRIDRGVTGDLDLEWNPSCSGNAADYAVYEGPLGTFDAHMIVQCSTGGLTSATVTPSSGDVYYLVVPLGDATEGSHGLRSDGSERPVGPSTCDAQTVSDCP